MANEIVAEFKQCWHCKETLTVTQKACQELKAQGKIPLDQFVCIKQAVIPLLKPSQIALTMPALVLSYDICAGCGLEYCTRAERMEVPIAGKR